MTRAPAVRVRRVVEADPPGPLPATVSTLAPAARRLQRLDLARLRGPAVAELAKFLSIGVLCTAVDLAVASGLHLGLGLGPTTAKTAAVLVATAVSYQANRLWAFSDRVDRDRRQRRDVAVFYLLNGVGLLITLVPVVATHYVLGQTGPTAFMVSSVLGNVAATVFRFWAYRRYVFARAVTAA